jgi:hypothetical protein
VGTANTELPPPATHVVTALYAEHALGLVRLAVMMLGDQAAAEDCSCPGLPGSVAGPENPGSGAT